MAKTLGEYKVNEELELGAQIADESDASITTVYSSSKVEELLSGKISSLTVGSIEIVTQAAYDALTTEQRTGNVYFING